jgi:hypothetical protein
MGERVGVALRGFFGWTTQDSRPGWRRLLALALVLGWNVVPAQELEPRKYSNLPVGTNVVGLGYSWSDGSMQFDPSLPIEDAEAEIQLVAVSYSRSFGLLDRNARLKLVVPWVSGDWEGHVHGQFASRKADGMGDMQVALEWNFVGAPALDREAFRSYRPGTVVGGKFRLVLPTGEYDNTRAIRRQPLCCEDRARRRAHRQSLDLRDVRVGAGLHGQRRLLRRARAVPGPVVFGDCGARVLVPAAGALGGDRRRVHRGRADRDRRRGEE